VLQDPQSSKNELKEIIEELSCQIKILRLEEVLEDEKLHRGNSHNRILITENFDDIWSVAE
jgi:hypothetical protein